MLFFIFIKKFISFQWYGYEKVEREKWRCSISNFFTIY